MNIHIMNLILPGTIVVAYLSFLVYCVLNHYLSEED
ncbi:hypothetical protein GGR21_001673 [Dysgonomonas hofstadii]|uniref:Uncharacterized protein n=1 Tax=Dysgonomonas hofstadii TaxID=637886 RepID=A0A840CNW2_9BACT|nr:hypothetical protein [Dysgonomonas hofstadii]